MVSQIALQAPPSTQRKTAGRPTYYEDLYGTKNENETFDRFLDDCESESESEKEEQPGSSSKKPSGFFKPYTRPFKRRTSPESEEESSSDDVDSVRGLGTSSNVTSSRNNTKASTSKPNLFQKRPAPSNPKSKKLTPKKKFGMFGTPLTPETDTAPKRSKMSDMLTSGGFGERDGEWVNAGNVNVAYTTGGLGDLNDGFPTLEQENGIPANPYAYDTRVDPAVFTKQADDGVRRSAPMGELQFTAPAAQMSISDSNGAHDMDGMRAVTPVLDPALEASTQEAELASEKPVTEEDEGYQADQDETREEIIHPQPKRRGRPPKTATPSPSKQQQQQQVTTDETPGRTRSAVKKKLETKKAEKLANRLRARRAVPAQQPTRASPRSKATARAATLRQKAKKVVSVVGNGVVKKAVVRGGMRKNIRLGGLRNWKGEKLEVGGKGYVVVGDGGEDRGEFERWY